MERVEINIEVWMKVIEMIKKPAHQRAQSASCTPLLPHLLTDVTNETNIMIS